MDYNPPVRRALQSASSFDEKADLWPVLRNEIVSLFGEERAAELLAAVRTFQ